MRHPFPAAAAAVLVCAVPAFAQVKAGNAFRVNTYTTDDQVRPRVESLPGGAYAVVWRSNGQDGSLTGIFGQRLDGRGRNLGGEFQVNTYTTGYQGINVPPGLGSDTRGNFVVSWVSDAPGNGYAQRFDRRGRRLGGEIPIPAPSRGSSFRLAVHPDGHFISTWIAESGLGRSDVRARLFSDAGAPVGGDFRVSTTTTGYTFWAEPAINADGRILIAWEGRAPARRASASAPAASTIRTARRSALPS